MDSLSVSASPSISSHQMPWHFSRSANHVLQHGTAKPSRAGFAYPQFNDSLQVSQPAYERAAKSELIQFASPPLSPSSPALLGLSFCQLISLFVYSQTLFRIGSDWIGARYRSIDQLIRAGREGSKQTERETWVRASVSSSSFRCHFSTSTLLSSPLLNSAQLSSFNLASNCSFHTICQRRAKNNVNWAINY